MSVGGGVLGNGVENEGLCCFSIWNCFFHIRKICDFNIKVVLFC